MAISIVLILSASNSLGQNTNVIDLFRSDFRQAEIYFRDLSYRNAVELYRRELERNPRNFVAMLKMAESYRLLKESEKAEEWYRQADALQPLPARSNYQFAQVLSSNQKYDEARRVYLSYQKQNPLDSRIASKIAFIDNIQFYLRDSSLYEVELANVNSNSSDFGPIYYQNGIVFLSSRDQDLFVKHQSSPSQPNESLFDLYFASASSNGQYNTPTKFQKEINSKFHEGPLSFGPNGTIVFTRNNFFKGHSARSSDGRMKLKLFFGELDENRDLKNLSSFTHNSDEYSTAHPFISSDGKTLYFSSDMPGGIGGADLYVSHFESNEWSDPTNLGPTVNTEGDEMFPFLSESGLFFSSDGHGGFGGLDIFLAVNIENQVEEIINLGYPANSNSDDFSFIMNENGRQGLLSSNRGTSGKDKIYNYYVKHSVVAGKVIEEEEEYLIEGVNIVLEDFSGNAIDSTISDNRGRFHLDIPLDTKYTLRANKKDFSASHQARSFDEKQGYSIDSVNVFMWAHDLFASGIVYNNETQKRLADVKITLIDFTNNRIDSIRTDENGAYQFLLQHGNEYKLLLEKDLFVSIEQQINTLNIKKGVITNDFLLEEQFLEKAIVLFEFNKHQLGSEYYEEAGRLLSSMKKNPSTYLIIGAHADSRGTKEYNLNLSNKRANSVLDYYLKNGISKNRIITHGFGEELIINRCVDGIDCHEEDHYKNRRAELKIERELPQEELLN